MTETRLWEWNGDGSGTLCSAATVILGGLFSVLIHLAKDQVLGVFLGGLAVDAHSTLCD